ncbi:DNA alkylation repair protein [Pseudonocardia kunmingensis]|uniref:3-methyladenine DNA glycosylase AlkD n=1 Tax=Pseudonocardia kunmingensis TaxID=630975 RepID=A0A543E496_9PSEU|nr:DNA alkylation repair protein [Pseudonocardia kunmingensis]TQM16402.1 3-methyladenine DNA glycosylase AlkD [Pseudonocardia kunmingensis]
MPAATETAAGFLDALRALRSEPELAVVRRRLGPGDDAIGVRMKDLFDTAKAARRMPLEQVEALFADDRYEARMGALCILDFRARARDATEDDRRAYYELYLRHLDRITTWDMVDRAAPSVVGGHLLGRSVAPLVELAGAAAPLRRRTAITAPLWFVRYGGEADLRGLFDVAALLAHDPDPVVHKAVGIALKHAGGRDAAAVERFLDAHAARMPRVAVRSATDKLAPAVRARFVG